jgi:aspartate kinase
MNFSALEGRHGLGARLSCKIMAAVLRDQGIEAGYVSLENIVLHWTSTITTTAAVVETGALGQDFYDQLSHCRW